MGRNSKSLKCYFPGITKILIIGKRKRANSHISKHYNKKVKKESRKLNYGFTPTPTFRKQHSCASTTHSKSGCRGFTLIELLVVVGIVGVLSGVILVAVNSIRDKARLSAGKQADANILHGIGDQMVGEWKFDDSSNPWIDTSGSNNNGSCSGSSCPTLVVGYNGRNAASFDGADWIEILDSSSLDITTNLTITAWFKTTNAGNHVIVGKNHLSSYYVNMSSNGVSFYTNGVVTSANGAFNDDKWHQVIVTQDSLEKKKLYIDGILWYIKE
ncbi:MAG: prepilin-type N-terminal cleavage/methylation domain-containing protein [Candidatus Moranbacteria bacterium]|nr:prepilin-type N-terminal cleavage/methylation domain-containing protein [Candidatus Moranbacteria bacterium]